jgi:ribose 5-phosphate isomerase A
MLIEKIVASMATRNIAVADVTKHVHRLGRGVVPVEVLSDAHAFVTSRIAALGGEAVLRGSPEIPFVSDSGNSILDCRFDTIADPAALATALSAIPGLFGHGIFLTEIDALYVADEGGDVHLQTRAEASDPGRIDPPEGEPSRHTAPQELPSHVR